MSKFKVLLTDYAWPNLDIERQTLATIDAELIVAPSGEVATLTVLAADADAIIALANAEHLDAHARSVEKRISK